MRAIQVKGIHQEVQEKAQDRVSHLNKPTNSLGKLEKIYVKLSGITGEIYPNIEKKSIVVFAADHGVFEEGVAVSPRPVTKIQAVNMTRGLTGVCALAKCAGADVRVVDMGIDAPEGLDCPEIIDRKIRVNGTANMAKGPAMSREEAVRALEVGIEMARLEVERGVSVLGTGEMGIGNTTPSAAILAVLGGHAVADCTGIGANLPTDLVPLKIRTIERAIEINKPDPKDPIDVLAKVGGLDIAGMAGLMLGGAVMGVPVIVDGFISSVAAMVAIAIEPGVKDYLFTSHHSMEKGAKLALEHLGLGSYLDLDLRLGEGTGAAVMFSILDYAVAMNQHMITFDEAGFVVS